MVYKTINTLYSMVYSASMVRCSHAASVCALNWQTQVDVAQAYIGHLSEKCDGITHSFVHLSVITASIIGASRLILDTKKYYI